MSAQHTPGQWTVSIETDVYAPGPDGKVLVAECDCSNFIPYEQKVANAQLIAAAPDLLAALRGMLESHSPRLTGQCPVCKHYGSDCRANAAQEAIDEAEGRPV